MFQIKSSNSNYLAKIVQLPKPRVHPNADKLALVSIDGQNVITGLNAKEGDIYVYFPVESALNKEYLSWSNSFSEPSLNADTTQKSFFCKKGRVRAIRLRGVISEGYIVPFENIKCWLVSLGYKVEQPEIGTEFDSFGDITICEKYINGEVLRQLSRQERNKARQDRKLARESKIIEGQFRFHVDTAHLKRNIGAIAPDDIISISEKFHGTSGVCAKVLVKKKLNWYQKLGKFFGFKVVESEYDLLFSSRKVLKNPEFSQGNTGFYSDDVWGIVAEQLKPALKDGLSFYFEIVGQTPSGSWIQNKYDYGCEPAKLKYYIYRITYTSPSGDVFEFSTPQIKAYCSLHGLNHVPYIFYGKAKDLYPDLSISEHWHDNVLERMINDFAQGNCKYCKNKVPREGVIVVKQGLTFDAFKLKSLEFLAHETKELDSGTVDMETLESAEI